MSDTSMDNRMLALAGVAQALAQVRRIADTGQADAAVLATALDSVFRVDAASAEAVYGDASALRPGLLLLRAQYPDIPVMIISAVEDSTVVRRAFELGAAGYLHKSVGPTEIRRAIETVLSGDVFVPEGTTLKYLSGFPCLKRSRIRQRHNTPHFAF